MFLRRLFEALIFSSPESAQNSKKKTGIHDLKEPDGKRPPRVKAKPIVNNNILSPVVPPAGFYDNVKQPPLKPTRPANVSQNETRKRDRISTDVRNAVWVTYHGHNSTGICYCCGIKINRYHAGLVHSAGRPSGSLSKLDASVPFTGWHCSHVKSDVKNGEEIVENLRTCCQHCNLSMGDQNLYVYIQEKELTGPGSKNIRNYLQRHPSQIGDKRTNNWGKHAK